MSCVSMQHRFLELPGESEDLLSWRSIAKLVRRHALSQSAAEAEEMLDFADLLDGFAELEK